MNKKRAKNCPLIFLSFFYIKPQRLVEYPTKQSCCFISFFYIKPQLSGVEYIRLVGALYLFSTSNHNLARCALRLEMLLYIFFLHQTTTVLAYTCHSSRCFISFFYIKPQLLGELLLLVPVALYLFSTSNHNLPPLAVCYTQLLYIFFLHQTTTQ